MAWSESMYIIQHFYNAFDLDARLAALENKLTIVAKEDSDGNPENITIADLTDGTVWFVKEDNE